MVKHKLCTHSKIFLIFQVVIVVIMIVINLTGCKIVTNESKMVPLSESSSNLIQKESFELSKSYITDDNYYANRTSASRFFENSYTNTIYYSNIHDHNKLYKYDIQTDKHTELTQTITRVQFISIYNDKIYFSGSSIDTPEKSNIYSLSSSGTDPILEIENAKGAILTDQYIYYHNIIDEFSIGISRKNLYTDTIELLVSADYRCSDMTMNIVDNNIYFHNLFDIFKLDITTQKITNVTSGKHKNGLNKLQYVNGYLYYYTYGKESAIKRMDITTHKEETVLLFNNGDFWYDNLLVTDDCIIFTGRQNTPLKSGESKDKFITGTFNYSLHDNNTKKIYAKSLGPTCYITNEFIVALLNEEDTGANETIIIDHAGNDVKHLFPNFS